MIAVLAKGDKSLEAGKIGDQFEKHFCIGPTLLNREVYYSTLIYHTFKELYSQLGSISCANKTSSEKEIIDFYVLPQFERFKEIIDEDIKKDPSFANSAIVKFCYSIIKDNKLFKELEEVSVPAENSSVKARISFQLKNLKEKVWFLRKLKEKKNFTCVQRAFGDEWSFYDLINDRDFKQTYIDKAVTESANESFKEDMNKCIELAEQGKETASKYFERKDVELQAYYTETGNAHRVLNINLIYYDKSEPTKISDVLRQEKDIKELNIYCNKKHEIHAHQKDKKIYYEFKEGACYEMTSTWPAKDGSGMCTMIMSVSSNGITEVLKFNGEDFVSSEEILELIKQNDELYIQDLSLYDAVMESLEEDRDRATPINFHNESIVAYQGKESEGKLDHKVDADNSTLSSPSINSNTLEVNLQHTETQPKIASQQITDLQNSFGKEERKNTELQTELAQKDEKLASVLAELQEKAQELENVCEAKGKLEGKLKGVNTEKKELEDKLKEAAHIMKEKEQYISNLKLQVQELEDEHKAQLESYEQGICKLAWEVEELRSKLECENEWDDKVVEIADGLGEKIHADEQRSLNDQFYTPTRNIFNETDNVPLDNESCVPLQEKITLLRPSSPDGGYGSDNGLSSNMSSIEQRSFNHQFYILAGNVSSEPDSASQKKTELSRSSSFDGGYGSDEENCDNHLSSNISSIEKVTESRNVGNLLSSCIVKEVIGVKLQEQYSNRI